jgi:hypothetical protein
MREVDGADVGSVDWGLLLRVEHGKHVGSRDPWHAARGLIGGRHVAAVVAVDEHSCLLLVVLELKLQKIVVEMLGEPNVLVLTISFLSPVYPPRS